MHILSPVTENSAERGNESKRSDGLDIEPMPLTLRSNSLPTAPRISDSYLEGPFNKKKKKKKKIREKELAYMQYNNAREKNKPLGVNYFVSTYRKTLKFGGY